MPASRKYTQRHFRDVAGLLAAEREAHGASPALSRLVTAFTELFAEDSRPAAGTGTRRVFDPVLFGQAARGEIAVTARRPRTRDQATAVHTS